MRYGDTLRNDNVDPLSAIQCVVIAPPRRPRQRGHVATTAKESPQGSAASALRPAQKTRLLPFPSYLVRSAAPPLERWTLLSAAAADRVDREPLERQRGQAMIGLSARAHVIRWHKQGKLVGKPLGLLYREDKATHTQTHTAKAEGKWEKKSARSTRLTSMLSSSTISSVLADCNRQNNIVSPASQPGNARRAGQLYNARRAIDTSRRARTHTQRLRYKACR